MRSLFEYWNESHPRTTKRSNNNTKFKPINNVADSRVINFEIETYKRDDLKDTCQFDIRTAFNDWHVSRQEGGGCLDVFFMILGRCCPMKSYLPDSQSPDTIFKVQPTQNNSTYATIEAADFS